ncbi:MAG TPA: hypothetical protein VFP68_19000, partial [Burkholderiaceae bacterium]|nr:hypothetical protein [Burkholderiaceae bacterium]
VNFPWILLDRALGTLAYVTRRAHARRDRVTLEAAQIQALLSEFGVASTVWPEQDRKTCERAFAAIRRHRLTDAQRGQLKEAVRLQIVRAAGQALEEFRALN